MRAEIFVPYNCGNNCSFCPTKELYNGMDLAASRTVDVVRKLSSTKMFDIFLLTGGEPLADLNSLKQIIGACDGKVCIVTTLPKTEDIDEVIEYLNGEAKIRDIAVSRHVGQGFENVCGVEYINKITKPVRINTVVGNGTNLEALGRLIDYYFSESRVFDIAIRHDYKDITAENVHEVNAIDRWLEGRYTKLGEGSCSVCSRSMFRHDATRTLSYLKRIHDTNDIYGNVIVSPDGRICNGFFKPVDDEMKALILGEKEDMEPMLLRNEFGCFLQEGGGNVFAQDRDKAMVIRNSYAAECLRRRHTGCELVAVSIDNEKEE